MFVFFTLVTTVKTNTVYISISPWDNFNVQITIEDVQVVKFSFLQDFIRTLKISCAVLTERCS